MLKRMIYEICWYMRGGISATEAWNLSVEDRDIINDIIKQNFENTKESGLPLL